MQYKVFSFLEPTPGKIVEFEKDHPQMMKLFEPLGMFLDRFIERHTKIVLDKLKTAAHPQEDYLKVSAKLPIFVVADGVTLEFKKDGTYPNPSGAGEAAKIFCETLVGELERRLAHFKETDIQEAFTIANKAVGEYNRSQGHTKDTSNFWDEDLFAATTAFAVCKDRRVYWASLCDSFVLYFNSDGKQIGKSAVCWPNERQKKFLPHDWNMRPEEDRKKTIRKVYRNGLNPDGERIGYGVVTGEAAALKYLNVGNVEVQKGDLMFLVSDGFEPYLSLPEFVELFRKWPADLESQVRAKTIEMGQKDPGRYAHERSIVAVSFY
jgi:hypothetical protein